MKLDFINVRRAYFHARAHRKVYVDLPPEDKEEGMCGRLNKSMYGTRDAAQNWEKDYIEFMETAGFRRGRASPCVFWHKEKGVRVVVHGDDFTVLGFQGSLDWFRQRIQERYEVEFRGRIGPGAQDDKSTRLLNRVLEWTEEGIRYEPDQQHADIIVKELGLESSKKTVFTAGVKTADEPEDSIPLEEQEATIYRALVARGNYLAQDRSDIQHAVKELSRGMANPTVGNAKALKRLGRYLKDRRRVVTMFNYQDATTELTVWTDTDFAGCTKTRKSTTGGVLTHGKHPLKTWSSTQSVIALSSGEAEYYGMVKAAGVALGMRAIMEDLGHRKGIRLKTDASAAKGISARKGLGKIRHLEVSQLWLQDKVANGEVCVQKVDGTANKADALTKHVTREELERHMRWLNATTETGRHELMPKDDAKDRVNEDEESEGEEADGPGEGEQDSTGWTGFKSGFS